MLFPCVCVCVCVCVCLSFVLFLVLYSTESLKLLRCSWHISSDYAVWYVFHGGSGGDSDPVQDGELYSSLSEVVLSVDAVTDQLLRPPGTTAEQAQLRALLLEVSRRSLNCR